MKQSVTEPMSVLDKTWQEVIEAKNCVMFFRNCCTNKIHARGLCKRHYNIALRAVKQGRVTWELLEKRCKATALSNHPRDYEKEFGTD